MEEEEDSATVEKKILEEKVHRLRETHVKAAQRQTKNGIYTTMEEEEER